MNEIYARFAAVLQADPPPPATTARLARLVAATTVDLGGGWDQLARWARGQLNGGGRGE